MRFPLLIALVGGLAGQLTCLGQVWQDWRDGQEIGAVYGVAVSPELTVAVGYNGRISTRNNQTGVWTIQRFGNSDIYAAPNFTDVVYAAGQFVVVRESGQIRTSSDGLVWTIRSSGTNQNLHAIIWDGGQYVVTGSGGKILTSPDGITWTSRVSGTTASLVALAFSGTSYVAVGGGAVRVSSDSVAWSAVSVGSGSIPFRDCVWTGSRFIVAGYGTGIAATLRVSQDGLSWSLLNTTLQEGVDSMASINGDLYAAGALNGTSNGFVKKSADQGATWEDVPTVPYLGSFTPHGNLLVAGGEDGVWALPVSPVDPDSLLISALPDEAVELKVRTRVGSNYQLEFSPDLVSWNNRGDSILGDGRVKLVTDSREEDTPGFYRLAVSPVVGQGGLVILDARYGWADKTSDVTPLIAANLRNGVVTMKIDNQTMGGDPNVGYIKNVVVRYQTPSGTYEAKAIENRTLQVPGPSHVPVP